MYKIISGDTTNLSENERRWFFHTPNPSLDDHESDLNPHFDSLDGYQEILPANARLRTLFEDTVESGSWKLLWLPPSLPYSRPMGNYRGIGQVTKNLVFSYWNMVPEMIAALCSYEAERRMVTRRGNPIRYSELPEAFRPLMRFNRGRDGSPAGMAALA